MKRDVTIQSVTRVIIRLMSAERNVGLSMHEEEYLAQAKLLREFLVNREEIASVSAEMEADYLPPEENRTCVICGLVSMHPAGWHYCRGKKDA